MRDICAATCWMGEHRPEFVGDEWIWAEYWTRYFTDVEPQHAWVAQDSAGGIVGYLTGTMDVRRAEAYAPRLALGIVWRVVRRRLMRRAESRRAILNLLASAVRGELELPRGVARRFPATWHFNLLPAARGRGVGRQLFLRFRDQAVEAAAPGIHAQVLAANQPVVRFLRKMGFTLLGRQAIRAFRHVPDPPMELQTWVLPLRGAPRPDSAG